LLGPNSSGTGSNLQDLLNMLGFGKGGGGNNQTPYTGSVGGNDGSYGPYGGG
jgi:hypothetical protein